MSDELTEDEIKIPGESELYDLWLETEGKAVELAAKLDLTNEDLERIHARWLKHSLKYGGEHVMLAMTKHILTVRQLNIITSFMRPDENGVPLVELVARSRETKGEA